MLKKPAPISDQNNFFYLFGSLLLLLFVLSLHKSLGLSTAHYLFTGIIILVLLIATHSLNKTHSWKKTIYFLIFLIILLRVTKNHLDPAIFTYIHHLVFLIFFIISFSQTITQIFHSKEVNVNMIIGSIAAYLQLGLIWSFIYLIILATNPHAFNGMQYVHWADSFADVAYFSFVTLTTLGFGDISPHGAVARFFTYSESIVGVFYMAIIVSTIVSARLNHSH